MAAAYGLPAIVLNMVMGDPRASNGGASIVSSFFVSRHTDQVGGPPCPCTLLVLQRGTYNFPKFYVLSLPLYYGHRYSLEASHVA